MKVDLQSRRLRIHEFTPAHFAFVHEYAVDPEVIRYQHWGPNSEEDTRAFLADAIAQQSAHPRKKYELAVSLLDGAHVGGVRIQVQSELNRSGDIGYILRRDQWGQGYGTELARAVLELGFRDLGLHRIWATADVENIASQRVLEKCGMQREGLLRDNLFVRGAWRSSLLFSILAPEFRHAQERQPAAT